MELSPSPSLNTFSINLQAQKGLHTHDQFTYHSYFYEPMRGLLDRKRQKSKGTIPGQREQIQLRSLAQIY